MMGVADTDKVKLYLRLPVRIVDEQQVRDLHPGISSVTLPRQKSRRWCIVEVDAKAAVKELKKVQVDGKKICVRLQKTSDRGASRQ
jgi:hypothetical protein